MEIMNKPDMENTEKSFSLPQMGYARSAVFVSRKQLFHSGMEFRSAAILPCRPPESPISERFREAGFLRFRCDER